jgi:hypothetical protein
MRRSSAFCLSSDRPNPVGGAKDERASAWVLVPR